MQKYKVTCKNCHTGDNIAIDQNNYIIWGDNKQIISGRLRLDGQWGFQCLCGQNSLMTKQEKTEITNHQNPDPKEIQQVIDSLRVEKETGFIMERI